jgi:hypothetical protein
MEKWYYLTRRDYNKNGAATLLTMYGDSPYSLLSSVFSEHEWQPWKFPNHVTDWMWSDDSALKKVAAFVESSLNITDPQGWYRISKTQLQDLGLESFLKSGSHMVRLLKAVYPHLEWEQELFIP